MQIQLATTPEILESIYRMRYEVYVEEMQRPQQYADHERRMIKEPLDERGNIYYATHEGRIVGTMRTNYYRDGGAGYYPELYQFHLFEHDLWDSFSITTKLIVRQELRAGTLGTRLAMHGYHQCLKDGINFDFIDCNPHLEGYFRKLGYLPYCGRIEHPEYGNVLPLVLPFHDLEHLKLTSSPFARILERRQQLFTSATRRLQGEYAWQH